VEGVIPSCFRGSSLLSDPPHIVFPWPAMRFWLLTVGPVLLVAASYAVTWWRPSSAQGAHRQRLVEIEATQFAEHASSASALRAACDTAARELSQRVGIPNLATLVSPPFVLVSNTSVAELERLHREALAPLAAALERAYFDAPATEPVRMVLLKDEASYRAVARTLDGYDPLNYDGYYQRTEKRLVVHLATGLGTLSHELCHAFTQRDCPTLPEWVDEGLAALHEETRFSPDQLLLVGLRNWRCRLLADSFAAGALPGIEEIAGAPTIRGRHEGLNYAYARSFCRFLQDRGLLSHFYRKLRVAAGTDPTGLSTLRRLLAVENNAAIDEQFRRWLVGERIDEAAVETTPGDG
jgi:hypothetical protein